MDRLRLMWASYLMVRHAADVLRDPVQKERMMARAWMRLDSYFEELERYREQSRDPLRLLQVRRGR